MSFTGDFSAFGTRLREYMRCTSRARGGPERAGDGEEFDRLARELFGLHYRANAPYRELCEARGATPQNVRNWSEIPAVPTAAFKELEVSCLLEEERTAVFHSSGTTEQRPSRHFHSPESLALYEASLLPWFVRHLLPELGGDAPARDDCPELIILTPSQAQAPHSSLVYMFEAVRRELGAPGWAYFGTVDTEGGWALDIEALAEALAQAAQDGRPVMLLGTAFLFVHLLDYLQSSGSRLKLPPGSRVLETGGYKGRSRSLPKADLHALITERLGIPAPYVVCEYGMSELSSQAYDRIAGEEPRTGRTGSPRHPSPVTRHFCFPPWARVQLVSPETGHEVGEGELGLIRVFDLANVCSVLAIQTEDLGIKRGEAFELIGRAALAEPRGCSLMAVS